MALPSGLSIFDLSGRTALVTGASRGIGWEMARGLAAAGASVAVVARDKDLLAKRKAELEGISGKSAAIAADLADPRQADRIVAEAEAALGRVDILVNNAGVNHRKPLEEFELVDFERVLAINLTSCFALAKAAVKGMKARGHGRIVSTSSIMAYLARPTIHAYIAAKGGLTSLTRALAVELAPTGVTVNAIAPGFIATDMTAPLQATPDFDRMVRTRTPTARWGLPADLVGATVFLASDAAAYVTGQTIVVDGGLTVAL